MKNAAKICSSLRSSLRQTTQSRRFPKRIGSSTHVGEVLTSLAIPLHLVVSTLEDDCPALDDAGADPCNTPLEDEAGEYGEPGKTVGMDILDADGDADKASGCDVWQKDEGGETGPVDGAAGDAESGPEVGEPFKSPDVAEALVVPGVAVDASEHSRLEDGTFRPPCRRAAERDAGPLATEGHAAPTASAGPKSARHVPEPLEGSPFGGEVVIVAPGVERGTLAVATARPPSSLAALSCSQTSGVTPSRRRWHSSHDHLPSDPTSSPDTQWTWARKPQSRHFLTGSLFAEPGPRSSPRQIGHYNWFPSVCFTFPLREVWMSCSVGPRSPLGQRGQIQSGGGHCLLWRAYPAQSPWKSLRQVRQQKLGRSAGMNTLSHASQQLLVPLLLLLQGGEAAVLPLPPLEAPLLLSSAARGEEMACAGSVSPPFSSPAPISSGASVISPGASVTAAVSCPPRDVLSLGVH